MKRLRWYDYITYNIYWLGLSTGSASLTPLIFPLLVAQFVAPGFKNTAYGMQRAAGLIVAILVQPAAGLLSDRSTSRWGRRRPFIAVGALLTAACTLAVGAAPGYWPLLAIVLLMQFSSNIAHGALQGIIPDLVPEDQRGRVSAVKAIMELAPTVLAALTIGKMVDAGQLGLAIAVVAACYVVTMLITVVGVREVPLQEAPQTSLREPLLRVLGLLLGVAVGIVAGALLGAVGGGLAWLVARASAAAEAQLIGVGVAGMLAIVAAIVVGVWASVHFAADARRYPSFTWWVVNRLLFLASIGSVQGFALYYVQDVLRPPNPAGVTMQLMAVVGVLLLVAAFPSGYLADRFDRRLIVALAGIVGAVGIVVLLLSSTITGVMVAGCVIGLATGVFFTVNWALGTDVVPAAEAGRFLGISNLAGAGAGIVASGMGGPLADHFNRSQSGLGYQVVFAIFGLCFLLSAIVLVLVRRPAPVALPEGAAELPAEV